jgi:hypothetical protein
MPRGPRTKNWPFTAYPNTHAEPAFNADTMNFLIVGDEVCPKTGRNHWQCFVQFKQRKELSAVKKVFGNVHAEAMKGTSQEARDYCTKEDKFKEFGTLIQCDPEGGKTERTDLKTAMIAARDIPLEELMEHPEHAQVVARHMQYFRQLYTNRRNKAGIESLRAQFADVQLRPWQSAALALTQEDPDPRTVHWFFDLAGNTGKSWFANYLMARHDAALFTNGKLADMAFAYNYERIVLIDLARTQADRIDHFYQFIESMKNGVVFSPKYESGKKLFSTPHVLVFANFEPDKSKLSEDRWRVWDISRQ